MCNCDLDEKLRADRIEREAGEKYSKLFDAFTDAHAALRDIANWTGADVEKMRQRAREAITQQWSR